ncbi:HU family DNA-binding protein [Hymenobacter sp. BT635]|uniref:HU family DNA-binding protein n=1 Tax=Hymenobacter nitidus TaxID=2880929 RepID=A0ABS8AG59_9BACT|nr:HU family DNA-binding protein [Hymenobacter nitidus]MCB2379079.1 HU family DNA-binding protein [Hymenobacter nitidus]
MPIEYTLVERGKPGAVASAPKKIYANAKSSGETTVRDLAERISEISTVSTVDVMAVLEALFQTVPRELTSGRIVRMGEFGSFRVTLRGEGAESVKAFDASLITDVNVSFSPGRLFDQAMQGAQLRRAEADKISGAK